MSFPAIAHIPYPLILLMFVLEFCWHPTPYLLAGMVLEYRFQGWHQAQHIAVVTQAFHALTPSTLPHAAPGPLYDVHVHKGEEVELIHHAKNSFKWQMIRSKQGAHQGWVPAPILQHWHLPYRLSASTESDQWGPGTVVTQHPHLENMPHHRQFVCRGKGLS